MTPFGKSVAMELRGALVPIETVSIVDHRYLVSTCRALLNNALFYVVPDPEIVAARDAALASAVALADAIETVGVRTQGISLAVDQARRDALVAFEALIDSVADVEPTAGGRSLGVG